MKHNVVVILVILSISVVSYFHYGSSNYWWFIALILFLFSVVLFFGTWILNFNYFITSTTKGKGPGISLTFDDGPDEHTTRKILSVLEQFNVKGTFFLIGKNVEQHPDLVRQISNSGHLIGSHSYSHSNKTPLFSTQTLITEIEKGINSIQSITGNKCVYFRPPFGLTNPRYKRALRETNTQSIGWSLRSLDTMAKSKDVLLKKISKKVKPGDVVLFHDNCNVTLEVLPEFLSFCFEKGINIVPLDENLPIKPYAN